jgi:hypothetical protein
MACKNISKGVKIMYKTLKETCEAINLIFTESASIAYPLK